MTSTLNKLRAAERLYAISPSLALMKRIHYLKKRLDPTLAEETEFQRYCKEQRISALIKCVERRFPCGEWSTGPIVNEHDFAVLAYWSYRTNEERTRNIAWPDCEMPRIQARLDTLCVPTEYYSDFLQCECGQHFRVNNFDWNEEMYGYINSEIGDYMCGDCLKPWICQQCDKPDFNKDLSSLSQPSCHQIDSKECHCRHECD